MLYGIPDWHSKREILLKAVTAAVRTPAAAHRTAPAYPGSSVTKFERALTDKLSLASPLLDESMRRDWFEATGLDAAAEPDSRYPLRTWLMSVLALARKEPDGYRRLALALQAVAPESPESTEVRKLVDGHESGSES
ncbi:hypothetical protein [Streptomyces sp. NPDC093591]|uniref:effector-associated domain 2-containing protein n=1 Tax=Streptomyces sp. NPDC093591 TaxID=3366044 RepID=UPI00380FC674